MGPDVVILPILLLVNSTNHRFPSRPAAISSGALPVGRLYSVMTPEVVIFPTLLVTPLFVEATNHRFSSGPTVMLHGGVVDGSLYSVIVPDVVIFPILLVVISVN